MKFRKKPVEVEAVKFLDGDFVGERPEWIDQAVMEGIIYFPCCKLTIKTLEGDMAVRNGDWIIQGVAGEIYPCKPEIFVKTYEPVTLFGVKV